MKMKKEINSVLFRSIIETEFFLLSNTIKKKINNFDIGVLSNKRGTFTLEMFELVKNLKQLIRILQFLNERKTKKLIVCSSNKNVLAFLNLYQSELNLDKSIKVQKDLGKINSTSKSIQALLLLEDPLKQDFNSLTKLLEKRVSIISKINSKVEVKNFGTYKLYNDTANYKKLAFLVTLLHQVFIRK